MFKWLFNLFKKKQIRLVAMISGSFTYQVPWDYGTKKGRITYSLYEREDGQRKVTYNVVYGENASRAYNANYDKTRLDSLIDGWACGGLMSTKIPSFKACTDLVRPVIVEITDDANLNALY